MYSRVSGFLRSGLKWLMLLSQAVYGVSLADYSYGNEIEFIPGGDFELGIIGLDIYRFPRYAKQGDIPRRYPIRVSGNAITGGSSLLLPGLKEGGYLLSYQTIPFIAGARYKSNLKIRSSGNALVAVEVFSAGWRQVERRVFQLKPGTQQLHMEFTAASGPSMKSGDVAHMLRIMVASKKDVLLDDVSLRGNHGKVAPATPPDAWIEPDRPMAVYPISAVGVFHLRILNKEDYSYSYEITDPLRQETVSRGQLITPLLPGGIIEKNIPLVTNRRGYFQVHVTRKNKFGKTGNAAAWSYVVINPDPGPGPLQGRRFFGLAAEEHGKQTHINALIESEDLYRLAHQIGAGSIRSFSLVMPDVVSENGNEYDFSQADEAFMLMRKYELEPFIVLGSNDLYRIPEWLRTQNEPALSVDLIAGMRVPHDRKVFMESGGGRYLDLSIYQKYLEGVFQHFREKVEYYELWNEPGHKFDAKDFLKIAKLTREVQKQINPNAKMLGYSSTVIGRCGLGKDASNFPPFIDDIATHGGLNNIDILTYHSGHAFEYLMCGYDRRNYQNDFVDRLRKILTREKKSPIPIWDTEFGISWPSPHAERVDFIEGTDLSKLPSYQTNVKNVLEVARQLPLVYAAAASQGVERLFWFSLDSSISGIAHTERRWTFYDGQLEPTPQLAVYDAMTEILGSAQFIRMVDRPDGVRVYLFKRGTDTVVLSYNWREISSKINFGKLPKQVEILDVMGNISAANSINDRGELIVDRWPIYVLLRSVDATSVSIK